MKTWRHFFLLFIGTLSLVVFSYLGLFVWVDPYDRFFGESEKLPVRTNFNERYFKPNLARKAVFNSAIFGTSTSAFLDPKFFDELFQERFVNLAWGDATTYEQHQIMDLFIKNHPNPDTIYIGLDSKWCDVDVPVYSPISPFPSFLYQDRLMVDLFHSISFISLRNTFKQVLMRVGYLQPVREDGYLTFLGEESQYSVERARQKFWVRDNHENIDETEKIQIFSQDHYLKDILDRLPESTKKIAVFVPYHHLYLPKTARWHACKENYKKMLLSYPNAFYLDFMIPSLITQEDSHYWDSLHLRAPLGKTVVSNIYEAIRYNKKNPDYYLLETNVQNSDQMTNAK